MKITGYDGIVVTGGSETAVHLRIHDDEVSILPADDLWGLDTMETLSAPCGDTVPPPTACTRFPFSNV